MSKKTQLAKRPVKPAKSRKGPRRNPAFGEIPFGTFAPFPFLGDFIGMMAASLFRPVALPPWWCAACGIDLQIARGVPPAGEVPFCPRCRKPMARKGAPVTLATDGVIDTTSEDVTYQRLPAPAPVTIEVPSQSNASNPAVSKTEKDGPE